MTAIGQARVSLVQSLAVIVLVLMALGLVLGIVKTADALKQVGAILGIMIVLMLVPSVLMNLWSDIPLWQRLGLVVIGIGVWQWGRAERRTPQKKGRWCPHFKPREGNIHSRGIIPAAQRPLFPIRHSFGWSLPESIGLPVQKGAAHPLCAPPVL